MEQKNSQLPITSRFSMLKALIACRSANAVIAVWSDKFENLLRLCTVTDVTLDEDENEVLITLCEVKDSRHARRETVTLYLNEIEQIKSFHNAVL